MFDLLPPRVWLLIAIALIAFLPARLAWQYVAATRPQQGVPQLSEEVDWRLRSKFLLSLAALAGLGGLAAFIYTPAAERLVHAASFPALLMAAMGAWGLGSAAAGLASGKIEPIIRGVNRAFEREGQPIRFWASLVWNAVLGGVCLWGAFRFFN